MNRFLLTAFCILAIFSACKKEKSKDLDPDHIQQDIIYSFDADNNDSYYGIRFYDNQWYNRVILTKPAGIKLDGHDMILNEVNSFYELSYQNEKITEATFVYTDQWVRNYTNPAPIQTAIDLPSLDTLHTDRDNIITWSGAPVASASETVTFSYGLVLSNKVSTSQPGATSVTVSKGAATSLKSGGWTRMRFDRKTKGPLIMGTAAGGSITRQYYSTVKWVYVK
jgi:hypothetical protein